MSDNYSASMPPNNQDTVSLPSRERVGQLIYEAVYASQGGVWAAVETREVWYEKADWFIEQLRCDSPTSSSA